MLPTIHSADKKIYWRDLLLPWRVVAHLSRQGALIQQFVKRDVLSRYRGSFLGIFWSLLRPLATLTLYSVVFGFIFESKLGNHPDESKLDFTLALFCGLILFDCFADCVARAPTLILANTNYVTKVVFPLEILPVMTVGAALVQLVISFVPLLLALAIAHGGLPLTALWLPVIILPLILLCLGMAWFLAALGVFIRDINSLTPVLLQILLYASAIFYSISRVPAHLLPIVQYNPLAVIIEQARNAALWGQPPVWSQYGWVLLFCGGVMLAGYACFMRTKRAFADVM